MNIYFAGSIRGGRGDKDLYAKIIGLLSQHGTVLTEHIRSKDLSAVGEHAADESIYTRDMKWLAESDVVVAEVTTPSLGVGYEIAKAEALGKRIFCFYHPSADTKLSAMIAGNAHVTLNEYRSTEELEKILKHLLK